MLMRKAIPRALSPLSCCTSRLLGDGLNIFLRLRKAEGPETYARWCFSGLETRAEVPQFRCTPSSI